MKRLGKIISSTGVLLGGALVVMALTPPHVGVKLSDLDAANIRGGCSGTTNQPCYNQDGSLCGGTVVAALQNGNSNQSAPAALPHTVVHKIRHVVRTAKAHVEINTVYRKP